MSFLTLATLELLSVVQSAPAKTAPVTPVAVATPEGATQRMELAGKTNGLQGLNTPYHLKATYQVFGPDGQTSDNGTYEEWRAGGQSFHAVLRSSSLEAEEFGTD